MNLSRALNPIGNRPRKKTNPWLLIARQNIWPILLIIIVVLVNAVYLIKQYLQEKESRYDDVIVQAAKRYRVPHTLIKAVVWRESRFDHLARGTSGEIGLMQIRKLAAEEWADAEGIKPFDHEHLVDPKTNTLAGTWYLKKLLNRYAKTDNPLPYALADYNAGRTRVVKWLKGAGSTNSLAFINQIEFPGTRDYVLAINDKYRRNRGLK